MLVHGLLVESVDLRRLGGSTDGNDVLGDNFDRCQGAPGEKEIGPLSRKGACDSAADRASGSVDHRNLVLQHHLWFLSVPGWSLFVRYWLRHRGRRARSGRFVCSEIGVSTSDDVGADERAPAEPR